MNPASAASAVEISTGMSGVAIAAFVVLALIIVILALALIHAKWPNSAVGKDVTAIEGFATRTWHDAEARANEAEAKAKLYEQRFNDLLKTGEAAATKVVSGFELYAGNEFEKAILALEQHVSDTSAEDADIVEAAKTTANAIDSKRAKAVRIENHINAMQKLSVQLNASLPPSGS